MAIIGAPSTSRPASPPPLRPAPLRLPRLVVVFAVAALGVSALALLGVFETADTGVLPAPQDAGEVVVLVHPGPASYFTGPTGEPAGFDVDIARLFARGKGLPVRFELADSAADVVAGVAAGKAHIGAGGLFRPRSGAGTPAAAPAGDVRWSRGYHRVEAVLIYNLDGFKPDDWRDLKGESVAFVEAGGLDAEIGLRR